MKILRKNFKQTLIYLAILSNISFFGSRLSSYSNDKKQQLVNLEISIQKIHNEIYTSVYKWSTKEKFAEALAKDFDTSEKGIKHIEQKAQKDSKRFIYKSYGDSLILEIEKILHPLKVKYRLHDWKVPEKVFEFKTLDFEEIQNAVSIKQPLQPLDDLDYLMNDENWNLKKGRVLNKKVEEKIKSSNRNSTMVFSKESRSYALLEEFFDFTASLSVDGLLSYSEFEFKDLLKKAVKAIATYQRPAILKKFIDFFRPNTDNNEKFKVVEHGTKFNDILKKTYHESLAYYQKKDFIKENNRLKNKIKKEIDKIIVEAIEQKILADHADEPSYREIKKQILLNNQEIRKAILNEYKNEAEKIYRDVIKTSSSNNPRNFNVFLNKEVPRVISETTFVLKDALKKNTDYLSLLF